MRLLLSRKCLLFQSKGFGIHPWLSRIFGTSLPVCNDAKQMNPLLPMQTVNQDNSRHYVLYKKQINEGSLGTPLGSGAARQITKNSSNTDGSKYNVKRELLKLLGGLGILVVGFLFVEAWLNSRPLPKRSFNFKSEDFVAENLPTLMDLQKNSKVPGLSVAVSKDGKTIFAEDFGYADVENRVPCAPETVFCVPNMSKPITMAAVAKLWEQGLLDLDKPVQYYVPEFPEKTWNGEKVTITTRQLVSYYGGIRNYPGYTVMDEVKGDTIVVEQIPSIQPKHYDSVIEALEVFKDEPLMIKPGTGFCYSSFGWILISAIVERAAKMPFEEYMKTVFDDLGLKNTCFEKSGQKINNQARQYCLQQGETIVPAPPCDMPVTFGVGAIFSNAPDLLKFGNAMLYSYQADSCHGDSGHGDHSSGYLKSDTMKMLWTLIGEFGTGNGSGIGMGWDVVTEINSKTKKVDTVCIYSLTTDAGGTALLLILPYKDTGGHPPDYDLKNEGNTEQQIFPKGLVVSILMNRNMFGDEENPDLSHKCCMPMTRRKSMF